MAKKKDNKANELVMHKLLGDHQMTTGKFCKICGVMEGQQIYIPPYQPVELTPENLNEFLKAFQELLYRVNQLQMELDRLHQELRYERMSPARERIVPEKPWRPWEKDYPSWDSKAGSATDAELKKLGDMLDEKAKEIAKKKAYEVIKDKRIPF